MLGEHPDLEAVAIDSFGQACKQLLAGAKRANEGNPYLDAEDRHDLVRSIVGNVLPALLHACLPATREAWGRSALSVG